MPVITRVPVSDTREIGGKREAVSLSDLYVLYGNPGLTDKIKKHVRYVDSGLGYEEAAVTFFAVTESDQALLDIWAVRIGADDSETIRAKVNTAAVADVARANAEAVDDNIPTDQKHSQSVFALAPARTLPIPAKKKLTQPG